MVVKRAGSCNKCKQLISKYGNCVSKSAQQLFFILNFFRFFPSECLPVLNYGFQSQTFWPKNVLIVTDGTCGSACALFVGKFINNKRAKVITHGGIRGQDVSTDFDLQKKKKKFLAAEINFNMARLMLVHLPVVTY